MELDTGSECTAVGKKLRERHEKRKNKMKEEDEEGVDAREAMPGR